MPSQPTENMEMLLEVGRLLSSKLDLSELLHAIMELAARVVNAETASLLLVDPKTNELYFDVALGLDPKLAKVRLKIGEGIAGSVAKENKPLIINEVHKDPRWSPKMDQDSGFVTRSILAAPISLKGKCIGVVEAINHIEGGFSFVDLRVFEAFASQAAVAIDNARLFASLQEEKVKMNTLLNEINDAAVLADGSGNILLANSAAKKFFSVGRAALPRTVAAAVEGLVLDPPLDALLSPAKPMVRFEATRDAPKRLILAGTSTLVKPNESDASARVIVFRDVTEEKHEEGLKRSFLSLISHKLKTPLASITGYSQLLLDEMRSKGGAEFAVKAMDTINTQGQKLNTLVEKLLNYTVMEQLDSAESVLKETRVDDVLKEAVASMEPWLAENRGRVLLESGSGLSLTTDPSLLRDVVKNLIENGIKFDTHPDRKVAVWAAAAEDAVDIHVRDSGPGIPPEEQDKIFNRFYQIEASFTGQVEGWGLGLSFVQQVVGKLGGTVRLKSRLGEGSTFTVSLPARAR